MDTDKTLPDFSQFGLDDALIAAVAALGFETPTPIQQAAIPDLLAGRDMIGRARTGSGKTAAFALPLLHRVRTAGNTPRALILTPTRELALQVSDALRDLGKGLPVRGITVYGGVPYPPQLRALRSGVAVVVGTPGRILDLMDRGSLRLDEIEIVVLDEADEMLRMGFIDDVERILGAMPAERQTVLFSATMPDQIRRIASSHMRDPVAVDVEEEGLTVHHIEQRWVRVPERNKLDALVRILLAEPGCTLVFTRTRAGAGEVAEALCHAGIQSEPLHGDMNQNARERVLQRFRSGQLDVVVATDVAARGIDVGHIVRVVNMEVPTDIESYVHRIGRTARAGQQGVAITLVTPGHKRRMREVSTKLDADIRQVDVPTDAAIAGLQSRALGERIATSAQANLAQARKLVAEFAAAGETSAEDIAAAALHSLAGHLGIDLSVVPDDKPPFWARPAEPNPHTPRENLDAITLYLGIGLKQRLRAEDVVAALSEAGVARTHIGRITIEDRRTFVGLPRAQAEPLLAEHETLDLCGSPVRLSRARPERREGGFRSPPRRNFKQHRRS